jgi:dethiobiotin synthetase
MSASKPGYFVTGTDTEIGKTLIASTMLYALKQQGVRAAGMKPVAAGAELRDGMWHNEDVDRIAEAASVPLPTELAAPYLLREPAAPHIVAANEGVNIDLMNILDCYTQVLSMADAVVVEGVGGFRVPLSHNYDTADLAQRLQLPVVMVVGVRLGCLSHALLTAESIQSRGLTLAGWAANVVDSDMELSIDNVQALKERLPGAFLGCVPRLAEASPAHAARHLDFSSLPGWPAVSRSVIH